MKYYYDFHIHTGLSPCADDDMTPNNIVNMSKLKGLDVIAITDHNSCKNVEACLKVAKRLEYQLYLEWNFRQRKKFTFCAFLKI
ncbi:PHP domain-containing protein [Caloramator sp. mosi_1]|uniref:PHP domain-containing protein n=1 Tax=Caloramator sp. mosi_1 TaxID=3023090 RepID=UPI00235F891D|nr:PHP domain-containing protein [Caloramator sp. mosi_1]WDC84843.1 PHP domain-containing protein [Caloramator sp. mosi_1]